MQHELGWYNAVAESFSASLKKECCNDGPIPQVDGFTASSGQAMRVAQRKLRCASGAAARRRGTRLRTASRAWGVSVSTSVGLPVDHL